MNNDTVSAKKLEDAVFGLWLMKTYCEKAPGDSFADRLCQEYKARCVALMDESKGLSGKSSKEEYIWHKNDLP